MPGRAPEASALAREVGRIREFERALRRQGACEPAGMLPGNAWFLEDGRVLCRQRERGDSRYPYGRDGFSFWVYASGYMHGNNGLYFIFLPPVEGQEPQIAFFLGQRKQAGRPYTPIPLLPVPYIGAGEALVTNRYTVLGHDAAYFITETEDLAAAVRVFVEQPRNNHAHVCFSVLVESRTDTALDLYCSAYMNPFCRHQFAETNEDRWFKKVRVEPAVGAPSEQGGNQPVFVVSVNEDVSRFQSITNYALVRRSARVDSADVSTPIAGEVCTSRVGYTGGRRRGLSEAKCLTAGRFEEQVPLTVFNDIAVVGDLNRFSLPCAGSARFDYFVSLPGDAAALEEEMATPISGASVDGRVVAAREELDRTEHRLQGRVEDSSLRGISASTFNHFVPFLRRQVDICAETQGYMHPSPNSLIGIRDVFQAIEGYMYDQPAAARKKMCEALGFVLVDGRCPRQYSLPTNGAPGRADLREFIDQGAWVVSTIYAYLLLTGDAAFLEEVIGYHEIANAQASGIVPSKERGSVLDHLQRIMGYLARNRDPATKLVLALYGDWNDALDGLGTTSDPNKEFGTGVSVMASLQVYQNCAEMIDILTRFYPNQHQEEVEKYDGIREELEAGLLNHAVVRRGKERRIVHGWGDERSYYVGSFCDCDGQSRDGLTSNAFWVLSGLLEKHPGLRSDILDAMDRLDSRYGMKTFEPGFAQDATGVGRMPKLPVGTAENAAAYIHSTAFAVAALFRMGEPRRAWQQIEKVLPFTPHHEGLSHSPFVMPNSYVDNAELNLTGQSMNDWQTGSSNVLLKILIRHVFGFLPGFDGLRLAPAAWGPFRGFRFCGEAHQRRVKIEYSQGDVAARTFKLEGKNVTSTDHDASLNALTAFIPYGDLRTDGETTIEIIDPDAGR